MRVYIERTVRNLPLTFPSGLFYSILKMSAPVLTISEQRASISGKKKKKKTVKNVLGIPDNLKIECPSVHKNEIAKLQEILNRLLPSARLPNQANHRSDKDSTECSVQDLEMRKNAKNNRDQLSLGVNALNKCIKKNLISAALLADDIQPKFLISHLNLLCHYNKIPFLHVPGLRETTSRHLGFPCIAVGFKTETCQFAEAVQEIQSIFQTKKLTSQNETEPTEIESSDSDEIETPSKDKIPQSDETPFSYLYRSSVKERAFIPEKDTDGLARKRREGDFISVEDDVKDMNMQKHSSPVGISGNLMKKLKSKKVEAILADDDDDEMEVPRKKPRKDWVIDKRGTKHCKYHPAKVFKVPSNPNRNWKKKK